MGRYDLPLEPYFLYSCDDIGVLEVGLPGYIHIFLYIRLFIKNEHRAGIPNEKKGKEGYFSKIAHFLSSTAKLHAKI